MDGSKTDDPEKPCLSTDLWHQFGTSEIVAAAEEVLDSPVSRSPPLSTLERDEIIHRDRYARRFKEAFNKRIHPCKIPRRGCLRLKENRKMVQQQTDRRGNNGKMEDLNAPITTHLRGIIIGTA